MATTTKTFVESGKGIITSNMMSAILGFFKEAEGKPQKNAMIETLIVALCNAMPLPMRGATVQSTSRQDTPILTKELAGILQETNEPRINTLHTYFMYQFPQISSSASTVVCYTDRLSGEIFVLWIEHRLYPETYLLPCGYRDVLPPYIEPNKSQETAGTHTAEMKQDQGWLQSFTGQQLTTASFQIFEEEAKKAGGYAKLPLHNSSLLKTAFAKKGFKIKRDINSEDTAFRELYEEAGIKASEFKENEGYFCSLIPVVEMPAGANPARSQHDERSFFVHLGLFETAPFITAEHDEDKLTASVQWIPLSKSKVNFERYALPSRSGKYFDIATGHRHLLEHGLKLLWESKIQHSTLVRTKSLIHNIESLVAFLEISLAENKINLYPNIHWLTSELRKSFTSSSEFFTYTNMDLLKAALVASEYFLKNFRLFDPVILEMRLSSARRMNEVTSSMRKLHADLFPPRKVLKLIEEYAEPEPVMSFSA